MGFIKLFFTRKKDTNMEFENDVTFAPVNEFPPATKTQSEALEEIITRLDLVESKIDQLL